MLSRKCYTYSSILTGQGFKFISSRQYSNRSFMENINKKIALIADESTAESKKTLSFFRRLGAGVAILSICSLLWLGTYTDPVPKQDNINIEELKMDIRKR